MPETWQSKLCSCQNKRYKINSNRKFAYLRIDCQVIEKYVRVCYLIIDYIKHITVRRGFDMDILILRSSRFYLLFH